MGEFASKGVAGAGLGLGIAGTALGVLGNNVLPGLFNMGRGATGCCDSDSMPVSRYEIGLLQENSSLKAGIELRDANTFTMTEMGKLRDYVDRKLDRVEGVIAQQAVHNATSDGLIACMQQQIAALNGLTKLVVPNTSVCPGWGNVTVTPAAATAAG